MKKPDIGIVYPDFFTEDFGKIISSDIVDSRLRLELIRQEPKIYGSIEWSIPGLIAAYIFKPYFESFLKEAGKEHYELLKKCLIKLLRFNKDAPVETITADASIHKLDKSNTQSKAISIHIELKDGTKIKLLFDNELDITTWISSLESILDLIRLQYENYPNDQLTTKLHIIDKERSREVFALINSESKEWEFLGLNEIMARKNK